MTSFLCGCPRFDDVILNQNLERKEQFIMCFISLREICKKKFCILGELLAISEIGSFSLKLREHFLEA